MLPAAWSSSAAALKAAYNSPSLAKVSNFNLRANPDFFRTARRYSTPIGLVYVQFADRQSAGSAVITPKKSFKRAVDRHAAKRKLKAVLQALQEPTTQVVIVANAQVFQHKQPELIRILTTVLPKT